MFALKGRAWRISISAPVASLASPASRRPLSRRGCCVPILLIVASFASNIAFGQSLFLPYGSTQYEYNNNVFALPNSAAAYLANGNPRLDNALAASSGLRAVIFTPPGATIMR